MVTYMGNIVLHIHVNGEIIGAKVQFINLYSKQKIDLYLEWKLRHKK